VVVDDRRGARTSAAGGRLPSWLLATGLVSLLLGVLLTFGLTYSVWRGEPEPGRPAARGPAPTQRPDEVTAPEIAASATLPVSGAGENGPQAGSPPAGAGSPQAPPGAGEPAAPPQPDRFADLMQRAERAFAEGRLAEPPGDNALDYYLTILTV